MILETIDLFSEEGTERNGAERGLLHAYRHGDNAELPRRRIRPALLVIPGGGYGFWSLREGEPIVMRFFAEGFDCFLLDYDIAPGHHYPLPLLEGAMAMRYLRRNAKRLGIDGEHVAAMGFSAGGHLAGCLAFLPDDGAVLKAFGGCEGVRPDAAVLCYPVVTVDERYSHAGSFDNLCADVVPREGYSLERRVTPEAPPCFVWATTTDELVPVENSMLLYAALRRAGVPVELHLYERGRHGLSTADRETVEAEEDVPERIAGWADLAVQFLRGHGFDVRRELR